MEHRYIPDMDDYLVILIHHMLKHFLPYQVSSLKIVQVPFGLLRQDGLLQIGA